MSTDIKELRRNMYKVNQTYPLHLVLMKREAWPDPESKDMLACWRSREYMLQVYRAPNDIEQVIVSRNEIDSEGRLAGGITHSAMQRLKREAGYGSRDMIEIFPADDDYIDMAGQRIFWVLPKPIPFKLTKLTAHELGHGLIVRPNIQVPMDSLLQKETASGIVLTDK